MIMILALYMAAAHVAPVCVRVFTRGSVKCTSVHSLGSKATETFRNMVVHFYPVDFNYACVCVCVFG